MATPQSHPYWSSSFADLHHPPLRAHLHITHVYQCTWAIKTNMDIPSSESHKDLELQQKKVIKKCRKLEFKYDTHLNHLQWQMLIWSTSCHFPLCLFLQKTWSSWLVILHLLTLFVFVIREMQAEEVGSDPHHLELSFHKPFFL